MAERRGSPDAGPLSDRPGDTEPPTDRAGTSGAHPDELFERGLAVRKAVLGNAHVDRALSQATELDRDFQEYITRAAWGEVWARPGLPRHTRHLLTIAMLAALDRQEELGMHLRATVNTGVSLAEVREVLLQVAVYAGVPAANSAFKTARRVLVDAPDAGKTGE